MAAENLESHYSQINASDIFKGLTDIVVPEKTLESMLSQNPGQSWNEHS